MERFPAVVPELERLPETEGGSEGGMTDTSRSPPPLMGPAEAAKGIVGVEVRFRDILTFTLLCSDHFKFGNKVIKFQNFVVLFRTIKVSGFWFWISELVYIGVRSTVWPERVQCTSEQKISNKFGTFLPRSLNHDKTIRDLESKRSGYAFTQLCSLSKSLLYIL